jgi:hypothetical protein
VLARLRLADPITARGGSILLDAGGNISSGGAISADLDVALRAAAQSRHRTLGRDDLAIVAGTASTPAR